MLAAAKTAIEMVNRLYDQPSIYVDQLAYDVLSKLTSQAKLIKVYDRLYDSVPHSQWSYAKLLTYAAQTEPYLHFDLDFIFWKVLSQEELAAKVTFQNLEYPARPATAPYYNLEAVSQHYTLPAVFRRDNLNEVPVCNLGCLIINDMWLNEMYTETALNFFRMNKQVLDTEYKVHPCVIEQQTLGLLLNDTNTSYRTLIKPDEFPWNNRFMHFMGEGKTNASMIRQLEPWRTQQVFEVAEDLDKIKNAGVSSMDRTAAF